MPRYKRVQTLSQLVNLKNYMSMITPEKVSSSIVRRLLLEGQRIIREAYEQKDWENRTYNLYNSYVAAVVAEGQILGSIYLGPEQKPEDPKYISADPFFYKRISREDSPVGTDIASGRDEAINFVESYAKQHKRKGKISLVVGAAMFYAGILESRGYHVLAGIEESLKDIQTKGLILTDYKVGNIYKDFKPGSDARLAIGSKHIAYRKDVDIERESDRKKTFNTKVK